MACVLDWLNPSSRTSRRLKSPTGAHCAEEARESRGVQSVAVGELVRPLDGHPVGVDLN